MHTKPLKNIIYIVVLVFALTIQLSNVLSVLGIVPDILMIFVVLHSIHFGEQKGEIFGFVIGIIEDAFGGLFGINAFVLALIAFLIYIYKKNIQISNIASFIIYITIATIIKYILFSFFYEVFSSSPFVNPMLILNLFGEIVYNAFISFILYFITAPLYKKEDSIF